jgi:hypothetical protein
MCFDYDGYWDAFIETRPKARKAHRCGECGGTIAPGEVYHKINYVFEGTAGSQKECARCEAVRNEVSRVEQEHGCHYNESVCPFGQLAEAISEADDHYGLLVGDWEQDDVRVAPTAAHLFPDLAVAGAGRI